MNPERQRSRWGQARGLRDVGSNLPSSAFNSCPDQARPLLRASLSANGRKTHTERNPSPGILKTRRSRSRRLSIAVTVLGLHGFRRKAMCPHTIWLQQKAKSFTCGGCGWAG